MGGPVVSAMRGRALTEVPAPAGGSMKGAGAESCGLRRGVDQGVAAATRAAATWPAMADALTGFRRTGTRRNSGAGITWSL